MKLRHRAVTAGIALALCGAVSLTSLPATVAYADPASDLAAAAAQLDALGAELAGYQERLATATTELEATDYAIAETQAQVESTSQQLSEKQAALGAKHLKDTANDNAESGAANVGAAPNGGEEGSEADDKAKVDAIVGIYNTTKNGGKK